ncbi:MAG: SAM-dependent chlorinase/fluorinase [Acidobacteriia bacterium]|nr:SAM-dependent chlorinase/fluorinase [Terriglobia bacterium]
MSAERIVTLTTDFGLTEHYVGAMRGVICSINPFARILDITNGVQSFDVLDGAMAISQAYHYFPPYTVHIVVVDPGVGGPRRPLLAIAGQHYFIAPDNGVLSLVYEREERLTVRHITSEHYFRQPVSTTFHGRDVFAPVAGYISKGVEMTKFGEEISDYVRFAAPRPRPGGPNSWKGVVLKIDKFGNLITNITARDIPQLFEAAPPAFKLTIGKAEVTQLRATYSQGAQGEVFAVVGSTGFLEICTNRGPASRVVGAEKGSEVSVVVG